MQQEWKNCSLKLNAGRGQHQHGNPDRNIRPNKCSDKIKSHAKLLLTTTMENITWNLPLSHMIPVAVILRYVTGKAAARLKHYVPET